MPLIEKELKREQTWRDIEREKGGEMRREEERDRWGGVLKHDTALVLLGMSGTCRLSEGIGAWPGPI